MAQLGRLSLSLGSVVAAGNPQLLSKQVSSYSPAAFHIFFLPPPFSSPFVAPKRDTHGNFFRPALFRPRRKFLDARPRKPTAARTTSESVQKPTKHVYTFYLSSKYEKVQHDLSIQYMLLQFCFAQSPKMYKVRNVGAQQLHGRVK